MDSCREDEEHPSRDRPDPGTAAVEALDRVLLLLRSTGVQRVRIRTDAFDLDVERHPGRGPAAEPTPPGDGEAPPPTTDRGLEAMRITAPSMGVFYRSPAPGQPPFVEVGDQVEAGAQLGVIEAMKVLTPVVTERAGTVNHIHVTDQQVVEYEQPLVDLVPDQAAAHARTGGGP